jgi:hypothetical protein
MSRSARGFVGWLGTCAFAAAVALSTSPASAVVTQPNGDAIPILPSAAEIGVVTSRGFAASAVELNGLFAARGEMLDYIQDAKTTPGGFNPTCGFTGQLVLRGGSAIAALGWYNVDDPTQPPPVYPLVPTTILTNQSGTQDNQATPNVNECIQAATAAMALCGGGDHDFCPLATPSVTQPTQHCWTDVSFQSGMIKDDPHYLKGLVGFALWQNDHTKQIKYSEAKLNVPCTAAGCGPNDRWVTALIWQSTVDPEGFYLGFEDLGMDPSDWHKLPPGDSSSTGSCDGDFNDFVYYVTGVSCQGGNQPCDTGLKGACAVGHTDCQVGTDPPTCRPAVQPGVEICDNVDNDCDGVIDNGDGLCPDPSKPICFQGSCVGTCTNGEFPCPGTLACDASGHCVDPTCASISCAAGTACRNGACVDPCGGVVCPSGSQCELGQCVDPCAGVTCPASRVCDKGLCVADCSCAGCATGLTCGSDGKCVDTKCASVTCTGGMVCQLGNCVDPCAGVVCPGGVSCMMGACPAPGTGAGGGSSVGLDGGISSGGSALNFAGGTSSGATSGTGRPSLNPVTQKGCGCRIGQTASERSSSRTLAWLASAFGLGLTSLVRRRRSKHAA